jgi:hypothetical protein
MTLNLHEHSDWITSPLPQLKEEGVNNIKVDDLLRSGMEGVSSPLAQGVQMDQAVNEHQIPHKSSMLLGNIPQELKQAGCFSSNRCKRTTASYLRR